MQQLKDKQRLEREQQFLYILSQVVELFPQYSMAQHLSHLLRRKQPNGPQFFFWADEVLLSKIEAYYDELKTNLVAHVETDDYE